MMRRVSADNHRGQGAKILHQQAGYMRAMIFSHRMIKMSCKRGGSIYGARAVLRYSADKTDRFSRWAQALLERRGHNKACVAVANKLARIAWVVMAKGDDYRPAV